MRTLKTLQGKLKLKKAMVVKADKGNTVTIIYENDYTQKVQASLQEHNFQQTGVDPTKRFQREIRKNINSCKSIIPPE
jgi:hypothetical protein